MSDVDRPLAIARYSTRALDTLGQRPALLTDVGHGKLRSPTEPGFAEREARVQSWRVGYRATRRAEPAVSRTEVTRGVMNQDIHLYAVSARLLDEGELAGGTGP